MTVMRCTWYCTKCDYVVITGTIKVSPGQVILSRRCPECNRHVLCSVQSFVNQMSFDFERPTSYRSSDKLPGTAKLIKERLNDPKIHYNKIKDMP